MNKVRTTWLSEFFDKQRELIEAAETPFAKLAVFVLPILAPLVPAFMTGVHLYKLFLEIFADLPDFVSLVMATLIGIVFELLGYVGAINFIKSLFTWVQTRQDEYILPMVLNLAAYLFYLVAMWAVNVQLSDYFGVESIVTTIVGILSFVTVPTSLLAATHLNEIADRERKAEESKKQADLELSNRKMENDFKLEKLRIKYGKSVPLDLESSSQDGKNVESSRKVPDWRKMRPTLTPEQVREMANWTPSQMHTYAEQSGYTYKTISNWRNKARLELGLSVDSESNQENQEGS